MGLRRIDVGGVDENVGHQECAERNPEAGGRRVGTSGGRQNGTGLHHLRSWHRAEVDRFAQNILNNQRGHRHQKRTDTDENPTDLAGGDTYDKQRGDNCVRKEAEDSAQKFYDAAHHLLHHMIFYV